MYDTYYHVMFTTQESYLLVFFGEHQEHSTLTLLDSHLSHEEHPLGRTPWIITGIATIERGRAADITVADPMTGVEQRVVTDTVLGCHRVESVAEAMVESVLARA